MTSVITGNELRQMAVKMPVTGVSVFVIQNNKVLLGKRKGLDGGETWGLPGGHLEFGESFEECASRETKEEVNINLLNIKFYTAYNNISIINKIKRHYINIFMVAYDFNGEIKNNEKDKCYGWEWFQINNLPNPLYFPLQKFTEQYNIESLIFK